MGCSTSLPLPIESHRRQPSKVTSSFFRNIAGFEEQVRELEANLETMSRGELEQEYFRYKIILTRAEITRLEAEIREEYHKLWLTVRPK